MPEAKRTVRVFYSWQSDLPDDCNKNAIRQALRTAAKRVGKAMPDLKVIVDEATRGVSGSPNIVFKIMEKILAAEMVVADITTVHATGTRRASPNPNVLFEVGYAVAELGWERVILLFNEEWGAFSGDLPFNIIQNRASPYRLKSGDPTPARTKLEELARDAITAVIKANPKRPAELRGLSPEKVKHERDVEMMRWLMSSLHLPTVDECIRVMPHIIPDEALWFFLNVSGVVDNSLFSLYDPVLAKNVERFYRAWDTALSHGACYHQAPSGKHIFTNPGDWPLTGEKEQIWQEIEAQRPIMREALDRMLARLKEGYIEINVLETNRKAWQEFVNFEKKFDEQSLQRSTATTTRTTPAKKGAKRVRRK